MHLSKKYFNVLHHQILAATANTNHKIITEFASGSAKNVQNWPCIVWKRKKKRVQSANITTKKNLKRKFFTPFWTLHDLWDFSKLHFFWIIEHYAKI